MQCWCGSHWDSHYHWQCSGKVGGGGSGGYFWDSQQDTTREDEYGSNCRKYAHVCLWGRGEGVLCGCTHICTFVQMAHFSKAVSSTTNSITTGAVYLHPWCCTGVWPVVTPMYHCHLHASWVVICLDSIWIFVILFCGIRFPYILGSCALYHSFSPTGEACSHHTSVF